MRVDDIEFLEASEYMRSRRSAEWGMLYPLESRISYSLARSSIFSNFMVTPASSSWRFILWLAMSFTLCTSAVR